MSNALDNGLIKTTAISYPWLNPVLAQLSQSWQNGRFHHAILFQGQQGTGKQALTTLVGKALVCNNSGQQLAPCGQCKSCLLTQAGNHPDVRLISNDKTSISVDEIRQVSQFVYQKSQIAGCRVVVIHQAEKLTEAAANALLKTLEEPCQHVYILLTCNNPSLLLATITSRCYKMSVTVQDRAVVYQWLTEQMPLSQPQFEQLFELSNQSPLRVLTWLEQDKPGEMAQFEQVFEQWVNGNRSSIELRDNLLDNEFAMLLFHHLIVVRLRQAVCSSKTLQNSFVTVQQITTRLSQFDRDDKQNMGQNKSLALLGLLNQLAVSLKDINKTT